MSGLGSVAELAEAIVPIGIKLADALAHISADDHEAIEQAKLQHMRDISRLIVERQLGPRDPLATLVQERFPGSEPPAEP